MEIFDSMAEVIRERNKLKGKTDALTSQGKLQGIIVGLMPTVIGVIMYFMDPSAMQRMFTSAIGIVSIGDVLKHRLVEVQLEANLLRDVAIAVR